MRIGILGGTFDPIHNGHLAVAQAALGEGRLDLVLMIPAGEPWQKSDRDVTLASHRLAMVRLGAHGIDGLGVDDREVLRPGPTYTIDTLESFASEHGLFLILGADSALGLPTWHRADEVLERATVMIVPRTGSRPSEVLEIVPGAVVIDMEPVKASATMIRKGLARGEDVSDVVPAPVLDYIEANGLYTEPDNDDMVEPPTDMEEQS